MVVRPPCYPVCDTKLHVLLLNTQLGSCRFSHGVVSPVFEPGVRHWQQGGLKHSVIVAMFSSIAYPL